MSVSDVHIVENHALPHCKRIVPVDAVAVVTVWRSKKVVAFVFAAIGSAMGAVVVYSFTTGSSAPNSNPNESSSPPHAGNATHARTAFANDSAFKGGDFESVEEEAKAVAKKKHGRSESQETESKWAGKKVNVKERKVGEKYSRKELHADEGPHADHAEHLAQPDDSQDVNCQELVAEEFKEEKQNADHNGNED